MWSEVRTWAMDSEVACAREENDFVLELSHRLVSVCIAPMDGWMDGRMDGERILSATVECRKLLFMHARTICKYVGCTLCERLRVCHVWRVLVRARSCVRVCSVIQIFRHIIFISLSKHNFPKKQRRHFSLSNLIQPNIIFPTVLFFFFFFCFASLLHILRRFASVGCILLIFRYLVGMCVRLHLYCQSIQAKLFSSKEIVAISCAWCKSSYHNKESCFNADRCREPCSLGMYIEQLSTYMGLLDSTTSQFRNMYICNMYVCTSTCVRV